MCDVLGPWYLRMKRVKTEQIQSSVNYYLKRRQFMEGEMTQTPGPRGKKPIKEVPLHARVQSNGNAQNTLTYSSISGDATACDQQFTRLKNFVQESIEPYRSEIRSVLFPMFVHVYLELLCNGHKTPAHKFHDRHVQMLKEGHKTFIRSLRKMDSKMDVQSCKEVADFSDNKVSISLSEAGLDYLMRHLKIEDNMIMLQMFNNFFDVEIKIEKTTVMELKEGAKMDLSSSSSEPPHAAEVGSDVSVVPEVDLATLNHSIDVVRKGSPCMPSICVYTFLNAYQGLSCASVSPNGEILSGGFEDSSVFLWSLLPGHIHCEPSGRDPSKIALAADLVAEQESISVGYDREAASLRGHSGSVYKTCFTPDSHYLLSGSEDSTVRLWDMKTQTNVVCYRGHNYPVWDVDASPNSGYFASCSQDRTVKLWCTDRTFPLRSFIGHTYDVDCVKFHPNGNYLATGSGDKTVRLWSIQDGRTVRLLQGHRGSVMALAISPDGKLLASAGEDRRILVWDLSTGHLYKELKGHFDTVHSLAFNKNNTVLASGGLESCIMIWDVRKNSQKDSKSTDTSTSPELLGSYPTKSVSMIFLNFSEHNVLQAAGTNL